MEDEESNACGCLCDAGGVRVYSPADKDPCDRHRQIGGGVVGKIKERRTD